MYFKDTMCMKVTCLYFFYAKNNHGLHTNTSALLLFIITSLICCIHVSLLLERVSMCVWEREREIYAAWISQRQDWQRDWLHQHRGWQPHNWTDPFVPHTHHYTRNSYESVVNKSGKQAWVCTLLMAGSGGILWVDTHNTGHPRATV